MHTSYSSEFFSFRGLLLAGEDEASVGLPGAFRKEEVHRMRKCNCEDSDQISKNARKCCEEEKHAIYLTFLVPFDNVLP